MNDQVQTQDIDKRQQFIGRMTLLSMLIFFLVPVLVVVFMYKYNWRPAGQSYGTLINPPQEISSPRPLLDSKGEVVPDALWAEKWSVVYVAEQCEQRCYNKLKDMRQLHVSLYKNMVRTQRILVTKTQALDKIKYDFPDMIIVNNPDSSIDQLIAQFKIDEQDPAQSNRLYFVDPLGFLMMRYEADIPLKHVQKDLKRLLKASWAG